MKPVKNLNLETIAAGLAAVLTAELGGEFEVLVAKAEHTNPDAVGTDRLLLNFRVADKSWASRGSWYSELADDDIPFGPR